MFSKSFFVIFTLIYALGTTVSSMPWPVKRDVCVENYGPCDADFDEAECKYICQYVWKTHDPNGTCTTPSVPGLGKTCYCSHDCTQKKPLNANLF